MDQTDQRNRGIFADPFDSWNEIRLGGGSASDISKWEDDRFVYYGVAMTGVDGTKIDTMVKDGYLTITGETKSSKESDGDNRVRAMVQSSFRRMFPLPENVDAEKMEMLSEKGKLVLKFPKVKTG